MKYVFGFHWIYWIILITIKMKTLKLLRNLVKTAPGKGRVERDFLFFVLVFVIRNTASLSSSVVYNHEICEIINASVHRGLENW